MEHRDLVEIRNYEVMRGRQRTGVNHCTTSIMLLFPQLSHFSSMLQFCQ
jgi:hypothetical protein